MLSTFRSGFDRAVEITGLILVLLLLTCVTLGVISREMNSPLIWTDEIARFIMLWLVVAGWIMATRRKGHIRINFFLQKLSPSALKMAEIIIQSLMVIFGGMIAYYSIELTLKNFELEATTVPISMAFMYAPMILAGLVTLIQALIEIFELVNNKKTAPKTTNSGALL